MGGNAARVSLERWLNGMTLHQADVSCPSFYRHGTTKVRRTRMERVLVKRTLVSLSAVVSISVGMLVTAPAYASSDPGVRGGAAGAGTPFANLTAGEKALFNGAATDQ